MNFWTSVFAVFIVDAVCGAMKFNAEDTFTILITTTVLYFMAQFLIGVYQKWHGVE